MFENSLALVEDCAIVHGHIFPYSSKTGTPAAKMPQVRAQDIKDRARKLREAVAVKRDVWLNSLIGSTQKIVVEAGGTSGHSENFAYVELDRKVPEGAIVTAMIEGQENGRLQGRVAG